MSTGDPNDAPPPRLLLRRAEQATIAAIGLFAVVSIGGYWFTQAVVRRGVIDIDRAEPRTVQYRVDINSADWPELAQLPGIGEAIARQIVAWRKQHGPFRDVNELTQIGGIAAKRLESIRPYLRPLASEPADRERAVVEQSK